MQQIKLPLWLAALVASMGGAGLFVATFLDSSVLTLPFIADALVIDLSIQRPARMPYYCAMAALETSMTMNPRQSVKAIL